MVAVGAVPQHLVCLEEEEAWIHSWDCLLHSWTATEGWQAGPDLCCHFCSQAVAVGGALICLVGPALGAGVSRWVEAAEGPSARRTSATARTR